MSLALLPEVADLGAGVPRNFQAFGGTPPYAYSLDGRGSLSVNGDYTAPATIPSTPKDQVAVVVVTDATGAKAYAEVSLCHPLMLLGRIIQRELGLNDGRVYLWDQKINSPTDQGLWVAISALSPKCYSNRNFFNPLTNMQEQQSSWCTDVDVDIISRGPEARDRKEEVVMALKSQHAVQQMELNSFSVSQIPSAIRNLSELDGTAIPYRFNFSVKLLYNVKKIQPAAYFDTFEASEVLVDP